MKLLELFGYNRMQTIDRIVLMLRDDDPALVDDVMVILGMHGIDDTMDVPTIEAKLGEYTDDQLQKLYNQLVQVTRA